MTSPFLRNRQRKLAAAAGAAIATTAIAAPDEATEAGQEYAALKVRLHDNLRQLQDVESHEARKPLKKQFLASFAPWVMGVVDADEPVQDEIVMTCMVWAIDIGEFEVAVKIGEFALRHGLAMPERYKRSVACFLREDIAQIEIDAPITVDHALLVRIESLTADADMPDAAKAKLHKALGRSWRAKAEAFDASDDSAPAGGAAAFLTEALAQLKRALSLDKAAGVKKDIEQVQRQLAKLREAAEAEAATE
ncbi:phage terminase small subunit [Erythrobacter sp. EC-HK427]|uniref:phage terminase small subunit n=1 Tax=Erythrobacter sp. EC-HK427 TaxID=2038396 RepID=UPI001254D568|nr:phage terminase small subunit [Erythrobacter sp. EC-HK427]VVT07470.1 Phage terminase, endonuclease subunit [Erythrobacter sp. EC-HK427]